MQLLVFQFLNLHMLKLQCMRPKLHQGLLRMMDEDTVTIETADGQSLTFERKAVAIIKPVIILDDEDFAEDAALDDSTFTDVEFE